MRFVVNVVILILVLLGLSFASLNAEMVHLSYYAGEVNIQLSLLIVLILGLGIIVGILASVVSLFILKRENFKLKTQLRTLRRELEKTRMSLFRE